MPVDGQTCSFAVELESIEANEQRNPHLHYCSAKSKCIVSYLFYLINQFFLVQALQFLGSRECWTTVSSSFYLSNTIFKTDKRQELHAIQSLTFSPTAPISSHLHYYL